VEGTPVDGRYAMRLSDDVTIDYSGVVFTLKGDQFRIICCVRGVMESRWTAIGPHDAGLYTQIRPANGKSTQ
jgi:hypothetical protein